MKGTQFKPNWILNAQSLNFLGGKKTVYALPWHVRTKNDQKTTGSTWLVVRMWGTVVREETFRDVTSSQLIVKLLWSVREFGLGPESVKGCDQDWALETSLATVWRWNRRDNFWETRKWSKDVLGQVESGEWQLDEKGEDRFESYCNVGLRVFNEWYEIRAGYAYVSGFSSSASGGAIFERNLKPVIKFVWTGDR